MTLDLLLAQGAEIAKAAQDLLHAEDLLSMWKTIAIIGWISAVSAGVLWQRGKDADIERLNKLVDSYQKGGKQEDSRG